MVWITLTLPATELLLSSSAFLFRSGYLSLPVLLAFCLQLPMHSSEKCLTRAHKPTACAGPVCVCVYVFVCMFVSLRVWMRPSVCTAMSLGCVIEMEMSQSATAVVCHLTLNSLHCSSSPKLALFVTLHVQVSLCVCVCVRADNTCPFSFNPKGLRRRCENVISWQ